LGALTTQGTYAPTICVAIMKALALYEGEIRDVLSKTTQLLGWYLPVYLAV
jgi:hypothetical protein